MQQDNYVKALRDCVEITQTLIATITLIVRSGIDPQRGIVGRPVDLLGYGDSAVAGVVVNYKDFGEAFRDPGWYPLQDLLNVSLGVVSDDEDGDAIPRQNFSRSLFNKWLLQIHAEQVKKL